MEGKVKFAAKTLAAMLAAAAVFETALPASGAAARAASASAAAKRDYTRDPAFVAKFSDAALAIAKRKMSADDGARRRSETEVPIGPRLSTGGGFDGFFLWDTVFGVFWARYAAPGEFPVHSSLDNFYLMAEPDGFIAREFTSRAVPFWSSAHPVAFNPPILTWAEMELYRGGRSDRARLAKVYPALVRHHDACRARFQRPDGLYFGDMLGCGMDDIPRWPRGMTPAERAGGGIKMTEDSLGRDSKWFWQHLKDHTENHAWNRQGAWIDMSSEMALDARELAAMADILGLADDAAKWRAEHAALADAINAKCWNESLGFYCDAWDGGVMDRRHAGGFWALAAGVATPERAARAVATMMDEKVFNRPVMMPSLSADDPDYNPETSYWCGAVWPPTTYVAIHGLLEYGYREEAEFVAKKWYNANAALFELTGTLWENISPEQCERQKAKAAPDFCGWSALSAVALPVEFGWGGPLEGDFNAEAQRCREHGDEASSLVAGAGMTRQDASSPYPPITIRRGEAAKAVIVADADGKAAALELRRAIRAVTGVKLRILDDGAATPEGAAVFRIASDAALSPGAFRVEPLGRDALAIRGSGDALVAGVRELMSRHGGCDWFPGGAEAMPRRDEISIPVETLAGRVKGNAPSHDGAGRAACPQAAVLGESRRVEGNAPYHGESRRVEGNAPYHGESRRVEGNAPYHFPEMAEWIDARLAAWPEADAAALTNRFVRGYYGPAADAILRLLPIRDFDAARWGEAIAAAESNPRILRRVRCAMAPFVADEISREIAAADAVRFRISREPSQFRPSSETAGRVAWLKDIAAAHPGLRLAGNSENAALFAAFDRYMKEAWLYVRTESLPFEETALRVTTPSGEPVGDRVADRAAYGGRALALAASGDWRADLPLGAVAFGRGDSFLVRIRARTEDAERRGKGYMWMSFPLARPPTGGVFSFAAKDLAAKSGATAGTVFIDRIEITIR